MIKKTLFIILSLILSVSVYSQVGINTSEPNRNTFLHISEQNSTNSKLFKGVLLAKYSQNERDINFKAFTENEEGLIIYNLTQGCFNYWKYNINTSSGIWSTYGECEEEGQITSLDCGNKIITPSVGNVDVNYNGTVNIPYTSGNGGSYPSLSINSTGVTGLIMTLSTGNFSQGNGTITFNITGVPNSSGTANFQINIAGKICSVDLQITPKTYKIATFGNNSGLKSNTFLNFVAQLNNKVNYGPNGTYKIDKDFEIIDISDIYDNKTAEELKEEYDFYWFGYNYIGGKGWTTDQAIKLKKLAGLGATMLVLLGNDFSNVVYAPMFSQFNKNNNFSGSYSGGYGSVKESLPVKHFGNDSGTIYGGGEAHASSYIASGVINSNSKIYLGINGSPTTPVMAGSIGVWGLNEYGSKVVFLWDASMFNASKAGFFTEGIDTPTEIFSHNLFSFLLDKSRGIIQ